MSLRETMRTVWLQNQNDCLSRRKRVGGLLMLLVAWNCGCENSERVVSSQESALVPSLAPTAMTSAQPSTEVGLQVRDEDERPCSMNSVHALRIRVRNQSTGAAICDASVVASLGTRQERLLCFAGADCACVGFGETHGRFLVTVTKPGYQPASRTVVVDPPTDCHVSTKEVTVRLRRRERDIEGP